MGKDEWIEGRKTHQRDLRKKKYSKYATYNHMIGENKKRKDALNKPQISLLRSHVEEIVPSPFLACMKSR